MASHLSGDRVNLAVLRDHYRRTLLELLDKCIGSKALVWDNALTGPFGLISEYPLLKEHDVDKMFPLRPERLPSSNVQNIIFIVRPKLNLMETVAQNVIKEEELGGVRKEFHIFFVPRKSFLCVRQLKELGVHNTFTTIGEYCLDLIPFDYDILSMEMSDSFRECYLENDFTSMYHAAKSLMTIQSLYGLIPTIYSKGKCAKHVVDMMLRMRREMAGSEPHVTPQFDTLLVIDRMVDPLTPFLSQLTYEGLLDEIFSINNTSVKLPSEKFDSNTNQGTPQEISSEEKKIILNSSEELFAELRDKNFNAVGSLLSKKAKLISAQFDERHAAKTVGEIRQFVSKLPHMQAAKQSLATHTTIAELIKEFTDTDDFMETLRTQQEFINGVDTDKAHTYIEDCIAKNEPIIKILRLICIQSICNNGFKQKLFDYYRREILQVYGYEHILTITNLVKTGLIKIQGNKNYATVRKSLKLIVEEVNEQNPNDVSYVFSGYAPLSVRLAQILHRPGWRSISEVLNLLPGPTVEDIHQHIPTGLRKRRTSISSNNSSVNTDQKVTLVFFLGGVTYAEISALRFLSKMEDSISDYIIATTKIINGKNWLETLMDTLTPPAVNPF